MQRLVPLFTGLGYYAKSIEVVCNGTPYLPWIWAPIKLILKVRAKLLGCQKYSCAGDSAGNLQLI